MKSAPVASTNTSHLTFTRFVAALGIVVFHFGREVFPFSNPSIAFVFGHANTAVSYFFILSGFVMILAYWRHAGSEVNALSYYRNRFARIYPLYIIALALFILKLLVRGGGDKSFIAMVASALGVQAWFPPLSQTLNIPGWSISIEIVFYLAFPYLFNLFYTKKSFRNILVSIFLIWLATQAIFIYLRTSEYFNLPHMHDFLYYFPLMHVNEFLVGNLAGLVLVTGRPKIKAGNYDVLLLLLVAGIVVAMKFDENHLLHNGLLAVLIVPFILLLTRNTGFITKVFRHKALVYLGEISYGIYILQLPVLIYLYPILTWAGIKEPYAFFVYVISLIVVSALSYNLIEKPLRERIKNYKQQKIVRAANSSLPV